MKKLILTLSIAVASYFSSFAQWSYLGTDIYNANTGNVGIGTTTPIVALDIPSYNNSNSQFRVGSFEIQPYGFNNILLLDNLYNTGSTNKYRNTGYASALQMYNGSFNFYTAPSAAAGTTVTPTTVMSILNSGNVGIGTTSPGSYKLAVSSSDYRALSLNSTFGQVVAGFANSGTYFGAIGSANLLATTGAYNDFGISTAGTNGNLVFATGTDFKERIRIQENGKVGIGTTIPDEKLTVKGNIHAEEIKVDLLVPGPDYVFEPDYKLQDLGELKAYLDKNHHLPEMPTAKEMEKNGISLGNMNMKLLKKVEELTLYLIEKNESEARQNKEIDTLKKQVESLVK